MIPSPTDPDIFCILDIEDREDSYSSLLVHLLHASARLRARVLAHAFPADPPSPEHATVELRKKLTDHDIVDVLLGSDHPDSRWRLFIESKLFSGEHGEQTRRYLEACRQQAAPNGRAAGIFLTLHGKGGSSAETQPLTHRELTRWIEEYLPDFAARPILQLAARAYIARAQVPLPEAPDTKPVFDLLEQPAGLVPHLAGTDALGTAIKRGLPDPWQHAAIWIQGHGHANPGLQFWRPSWRGTELTGTCWTPDNVFAHLEIELTEWPPWRLKLHFETEPYLTQAEINSLDGHAEFVKMREAFRTAVHTGLGASTTWRRSNYALQTAAFKFTPKLGLTVDDLRTTLVPAIVEIAPVVEAALTKIHPVPPKH